MSDKPDNQSPSRLARANRLRLAAEEGARAMEEAAQRAVAVRQNMARLRELRLGKEAAVAPRNDPKPKPKKRSRQA